MNNSHRILFHKLAHQAKVPGLVAGISLLSVSLPMIFEDDGVEIEIINTGNASNNIYISSYQKFWNDIGSVINSSRRMVGSSSVLCEASSNPNKADAVGLSAAATVEKLDNLRKDAAEYVKSFKDQSTTGSTTTDDDLYQQHPKSLKAFFNAMENDPSTLNYDDGVEEYNHDDCHESGAEAEKSSSMVATTPSAFQNSYVRTKK